MTSIATAPFNTRLLWARESLRDEWERAGYVDAESIVRAMHLNDLRGDQDAFVTLADEFGVE